MHIYILTPHTENFFMFPVQYLVPNFLTRAVLCAGKEAWKRRPFLLSSQICSNYRITSICGSLAAFSLPPPPLSSPSILSFPLLFFYLHSPLFLFFPCFFIFLACPHALLCKNHSSNKLCDNQNILAFLANECTFLVIQLDHACQKKKVGALQCERRGGGERDMDGRREC